MEIQHLRVFLAVAEELHFARAAEKLHMAQPTLSRLIQQFERELGTRLFERSTRTVRLTSSGEALVGPANEVLDSIRRAVQTVKAAGLGEVGRVRVAYAGASTHVLVGRLAKEVRRQHPGISFEMSSSNFAGVALDKVVRGEMEIGLGRWEHVPRGVSTRVIADESLVLAVPASHPLADRQAVSMSELRDEPFVSLPPNSGSMLTERLRRLSAAAGFVADVVQVAPDSWTLMALVEAEIGVSLTVSSVAENVSQTGVVWLRLLDATEPIQLRMAWLDIGDKAALHAVLRVAETVLPSPG